MQRDPEEDGEQEILELRGPGGGGGLLPAPSREPSCSQADWSVISATTGGTGPLTVLLKPGPLAQHRGSYRPGMHLP